jgi:SAM-dependent methyltransferase
MADEEPKGAARMHAQVLKDMTATVVGPGAYAMDEPLSQGREIELPYNGSLTIRGWAFAEVAHPVPEKIFVEVVSEFSGKSTVVEAERTARGDVADHFGDRGLALSGFTAHISLAAPCCGKYAVHLLQQGVRGAYRNENILRLSARPELYEPVARAGLANKFLSGKGIEIGALQRKLPVPPGCSVQYVDRMNLSDLRKHYPELNGVPLTEPDVIDDGERLTRFADDSLDFLIANHFLEHCKNPIGTLRNLLRVLRPAGILYMAVPDKRFTFDFARPCTEWEILKTTFGSGKRADKDHLYLEWAEYVMKSAGEEAEQTAKRLADEDYSIHFNVWDLQALLEFLWGARAECRLPFTVCAVVSSENENILVLAGC